ncbi:TolC family protein, partial [Corynebacterium sp. 35RC1]|nr:TolC family protein [Corynebacterium sp. 35RC1]
MLKGIQALHPAQERRAKPLQLAQLEQLVASLDAQIATTQRLAAEQRKQLEITERRLSVGGVTQVDAFSQRTLVAQTDATLPPLAQQAAQQRHRLSVLLGREPGAGLPDLPSLDALHLPDPLPVSLPSTLA